MDHIPLSEVDFVLEMKDSTSDTEDHKEDTTVRHKMQIATLATGYNSGRTYYIATHSKDLLDKLISKLRRYAKIERSRAEASSIFRKTQLKVRKRYESNLVQGVMAILIGAVRNISSGQLSNLAKFFFEIMCAELVVEIVELWMHNRRVTVRRQPAKRRRFPNNFRPQPREDEPLLHAPLHRRAGR